MVYDEKKVENTIKKTCDNVQNSIHTQKCKLYVYVSSMTDIRCLNVTSCLDFPWYYLTHLLKNKLCRILSNQIRVL